MRCGKSAKVTLAVALGIALGWTVFIGSGVVFGWMEDDDVALNIAMAVATSGGLFTVSQPRGRKICGRKADTFA